MQFRLLKRRTVSALATTALAAGALTVPVALMAAPAQAGETTGEFACTYGDFSLAYTPTISVDGGWDKTAKKFALDAELDGLTMAGMPPFVTYPDSTVTATVTASMAGKPVTLTGEGQGAFTGGAKLNIPPVTGQVAAVDGASALTITNLAVRVVSNDPLKVLDVTIPCAPTAPITVQALPSLVMACTTFGSTFGYATEPNVSAAATPRGKVRMTVGLDDMPGVVPVPLTNVPVSGTLDIKSGDITAQLAGNHTVPSIPSYEPIPVPELVGEMASDASTVTFSVESAAFIATAMGSAVAIPCVVNAATSYTVDVQPVSEACIDADAVLVSAEADLASATTAANNAADGVATATTAAATASGAAASATSAANAATAGVNTATAKIAAATAEVDAATAAVNAAPAEIAAATAKADAATAAVATATAAAKSANAAATKATKAAKKAAAAYKKASAKAKKAKGKKAKAKAKKAKSKASKAKSKTSKAKSKASRAKAQAGTALSAASAQLNAATAQLATAKAKPAAASARLVAAKAALVAADADLVTAKEKSAAAATALAAAKAALDTANADLATATDQSAAADLVLEAAQSALADAQADVDENC